MITNLACKELFIKYLEYFSEEKPKELKILIVDNAAFHSKIYVKLPKKHSITKYSSLSTWIKSSWKSLAVDEKNMVMKIYDLFEILEQLIENLEGEIIKSITAYEFYIKTYYSIFKV